MVGTTTVQKGLELAEDANLDLVEISPNASPPVCKIIDYGKYKYTIQKKANEAKKKQKTIELKEIKVRPNIAEGDFLVKLRNIKKFIAEGNKVKTSLSFKGREISHNEVGFSVINKLKIAIEEFAKIESEPKMEGKQIFMIISPK